MAVLILRRGTLAFLLALSIEAQDSKTKGADSAVDRALKYIVAQQKADGSFPAKQAEDLYPFGVTAFAILALLTRDGPEPSIEKAARFLIESMDGKGFIAVKEGRKSWHACTEHGYAALALVEVYLKFKDTKKSPFGEGFLERLKAAAEKALAFSAEIQVKEGRWSGAWPYNTTNTAFHLGESSVGLGHLEALRSAKSAGLARSDEAFRRGVEFVKKNVDEDGRLNDHPFSSQRSPYVEVTASAAALLYGAEERETAARMRTYVEKTGAERLAGNLPEKEKAVWLQGGVQLWGVFHAYLCFRRSGDAARLAGWFEHANEKLRSTQAEDGSWTGLYGSVWGTALAVMVLEAEKGANLRFLQ